MILCYEGDQNRGDEIDEACVTRDRKYILAGKCAGKIPLSLGRIRKDNIKADLKEIG
jgi:hypothetical protein